MSGLKNMNCRHRLLVILMFILSPSLQAEPQKEEESPTPALLEFLGEWENSDGQWIDPEEFADEDFANLLKLTNEEDD